jgi:phage host-nuclease inhibitor protein Gam
MTRKVTRAERQILHEIERVQQSCNNLREQLERNAKTNSSHYLLTIASDLGKEEGRLRGLNTALQWLELEGLNLITMLPEGEN